MPKAIKVVVLHPRTWKMRQTSEPGVGWLVNGPSPERFETVEVIEKAPVDAERERLLDLLEAVKREIECPEDALRAGIPVYAEIRQCLREHGRLPKEA